MQGGSSTLLQVARDFAEAELHLQRVRGVKHQLVRDDIARASGASENAGTGALTEPSDISVDEELLKALEKIERYERRAFSRRRQAARALPLSQQK